MRYADCEIRVLLEPFESLANDKEFWNRSLDGLAVFGAPGFFHAFGLQRTVPELAVVADSFHTKPLWRFLQSAGRYQVLALSLGRIRLFEGNRYALDEIDLAPVILPSVDPAIGPCGSTATALRMPIEPNSRNALRVRGRVQSARRHSRGRRESVSGYRKVQLERRQGRR